MSHFRPLVMALISDATAFGRSLLGAADAAAARTAIGAVPTALAPLGSCVSRHLIAETSGTTVADSVGAYNLAAGSGILAARGGAFTPWGRTGFDALAATGATDLTPGDAPAGSGPTLGDAFTILCWYLHCREIVSNDRFLIGFRKSSSVWNPDFLTVSLKLDVHDVLKANCNTAGGASSLTAPRSARPHVGRWSLLAFRRTRNATQAIVHNGVEAVSGAAADSALDTIAGPMIIAGNAAGGSPSVAQSPPGVVRDVQVHNVALSDAALLAMYRGGIGR